LKEVIVGGSELWLREVIHGLVILGVILLFISGCMHFTLSPGIKRRAPVAARLNSEVIDAAHNSEETVLAPVCTPRVTHIPELDSILLTIADDCDFVDRVSVTSIIVEDATFIIVQFLSDSDRTGKRTSLD